MTNRIFPIKTETSCLLKWAWSTVFLSQGTSSSCHRTNQTPIPPDNFESFHNLPNKIRAREQMLQGEWPQEGCQYCEKIEKAGGTSDRQYQFDAGHDVDQTPIELFSDPTAVEIVPTILEIYFSNTCNMACLYCGSHFSSKWEEENKKFGTYKKGLVGFAWKDKQNINYNSMLVDFWAYLEKNNNYLRLRQYQIAGGEPFYQKEFEQSIDFWESHPNPELTFNMITNLKVKPEKFREYINRFENLVASGKIKRLQISSSLDAWGPQQEYVRWGLDLNEWVENFEYLLDKPFVQQCINSAINPLTIKTMPELITRLKDWNDRKILNHKITHSFMSVMEPLWMDPAIFGAGVFEEDFAKIIDAMPKDTDDDCAVLDHMEGIGRQIANAPRNVAAINGLKDYLTEIDRRRGTNWKELFPWLDQDWK